MDEERLPVPTRYVISLHFWEVIYGEFPDYDNRPDDFGKAAAIYLEVGGVE